MALEFRILGPLEVVVGEESVPLGPLKRRAVLAVLLLNMGRTVSRDGLVDAVWGEAAPSTAGKSVQNHVSHLRKLLPADTLLTRAPGYVIEDAAGELDLDRFEELVHEGREARDSGSLQRSAALLREAIDLWRGPALDEFRSEPFAIAEGRRLEEGRLVAVEEWLESELALGRHAEVLGELESLVTQCPLRERLQGQLMLALYRSDRQAEALGVYREARRQLVEQLGIEPSSHLQELERAILRHDASLAVPPSGDGSGVAAARRRPGSGVRNLRVVPSDSTNGDLASTDGAPVFVGREVEMQRLDGVLRQVLGGRGRTVLLVGEPGIGKTRMAFELSARAEQVGFRVYWGRCYQRAGTPPYWPWAQAVRGYIRDCESERLRAELAAGGPDVAEVIPDVRERIPDLSPRPAIDDPRMARLRLFDSLAVYLRNASSAQPLALILDDLHWADIDSLSLLEFLAGELAHARILLVGIYRDVEVTREHPLVHTLADLTKKDLVDRLILDGLSKDDVGQFFVATSGVEPPVELVEAVHARTEGNPLFVTEVERLLRQEGKLTEEQLRTSRQWSFGLPPGVRDVIGARLARLTKPCNEMLKVAAVIGREFRFGEVDRLIDDLADESLLAVLEEAMDAQVIEELPGAPDHFRFTHALVQEVLELELSSSRRVRLHARIARALEELYAGDVGTHAAELAHHFAEAESVLGSDDLVLYSLRAGENALAAYSYEEAIAQFERGLAARSDEPMSEEVASLLFGLGRARLAVSAHHELGEAASAMRRAFDYYVDAGEPERAVIVAGHPVLPSWTLGQTEFRDIVRRALDLVESGSLEEGRLLATHGWFLGAIEADYEGARDAIKRALAISERVGDAALERNVLAKAAQVERAHLQVERCLEAGLRLEQLAEEANDIHARLSAAANLTRILTVKGAREQARARAAATLEDAEQLRDSYGLASAHAGLLELAALEGDWREARRLGDLALASQPDEPRLLSPRALVEYETGDFELGTAYVERLRQMVERYPSPGPLGEHAMAAAFIPLFSLISGLDEGNDYAQALAEELLSLPRLMPFFQVHAQTGLALLAVQRQDTEEAERLYSALEPQRGTAIPLSYISADRLLGLLASAFGARETAAGHFRDALAFCERAGYRPEHAWTAADYADALEGSGHPEMREAGTLRDEALSIAREFGMLPLVERVDARRQRLTG